MYDIICCIIFGFFIVVGISDTLHFLTKLFFKFDKFSSKTLSEENIEYILRSSKYSGNTHEINPAYTKKHSEEFKFIYENLN